MLPINPINSDKIAKSIQDEHQTRARQYRAQKEHGDRPTAAYFKVGMFLLGILMIIAGAATVYFRMLLEML